MKNSDFRLFLNPALFISFCISIQRLQHPYLSIDASNRKLILKLKVSKNCQLYQSCKIEIRKFLSFDFRIHAWEWRKSLNPWKYKSVVWSYRRLKIQILNLNFDQNRIWLLSWTWAKKSKLIYIMHLIPELDLTAILYQCSG